MIVVFRGWGGLIRGVPLVAAVSAETIEEAAAIIETRWPKYSWKLHAEVFSEASNDPLLFVIEGVPAAENPDAHRQELLRRQCSEEDFEDAYIDQLFGASDLEEHEVIREEVAYMVEELDQGNDTLANLLWSAVRHRDFNQLMRSAALTAFNASTNPDYADMREELKKTGVVPWSDPNETD